jgi:cardiolipin synthase
MATAATGDLTDAEKATRAIPPARGRPLRPPLGVNIAPGPDDDGWVAPPPARLADGTQVQLYKDGEALHAAYRAIASARHTVDLEVYIFHSDSTGRAFAQLLAERARAGLDVRVLYDSVGSFDSDRSMFGAMRRAGVRLREFHPVMPWCAKHGWRPFNRDHRKLLVVDDEVGVLGGQNLGNEYGSSWVVGRAEGDCWRDTAVGLDGPSVRLLSASFARMWDYVVKGGPTAGAEFFHSSHTFRDDPGGSLFEGEPTGRVARGHRLGDRRSVLDIPEDSVAVLASVPTPRSRLLPNLQKLLRDAGTSIELTMAYFAPPEELLEQLCRSARHGVRVRLMLPGRSDVPLMVVAARAFYDTLMDAGVEVYERQHAVLHAKSLCVDRRIAIVGSTNLDYRSIQYNCELSAVINSCAFGGHMHELFENDVCYARRILPDEWRHRPVRDRLVQWAVMRARQLL